MSAHDDHVLLVSPVSSFTAHPYFHDKLPYDPKDLIPIARISKTVVAVSVPTSLKRQFAERTGGAGARQARPIELDHGHRLHRFRICRIPARGRPEDGESALQEPGRRRRPISPPDVIQVYMPAYAIVRPQVQAGTVKVLAVTNHERAPAIPDVPTAIEAGYPVARIRWVGRAVRAARASPTRCATRSPTTSARSPSDPEIVKSSTATGQIVSPGNAAEFAASIAQQRAQVAAVAKLFGNKPMQ